MSEELPSGFTLKKKEDKSLVEKGLDIAAGTVDTFTDLGKGAVSGAIGIPQGLAETVSIGIDAVLQTNLSNRIERGSDRLREVIGVDDLQGAGKLSEGVVTFGAAAIPIVGWLGRASHIAKGGKVLGKSSKFMKSAESFGASETGKKFLGTKLRRAGTTAGALGIADALVSPDSTSTIGDAFEVLPDIMKTDDTEGLTGIEESIRRAKNKAKVGVEGSVLGAIFEAVPVVGGIAGTLVSQIPGVPTGARVLSEKLTQGVDFFTSTAPGVSSKLQKYFTSKGNLPSDMYEGLQDVKLREDSEAKRAELLYKNFETEAKNVVQGSKLFGKGKAGIAKAEEDLHSYLIGKIDETDLTNLYNKKMSTAAVKLRSSIDEMTDMLMKDLEDIPSSQLNPAFKQQIITEFSGNQGKYLHRMYTSISNPAKWIKDDRLYNNAVDEVVNLMAKNLPLKASTTDLRANAEKVVDDILNFQMTEKASTLKKGLEAINGSMKEGKAASRGPSPVINMAQGILKRRNKYIDKSPALREYMGEITDPKELYLRTVGDMSSIVAGNRFYRDMANQFSVPQNQALQMISSGLKPMIIDGKTVIDKDVANVLSRNGYTKLGELKDTIKAAPAEQAFGGAYGELSGSYIKNELLDSFQNAGRNQGFWSEALATSLLAKGASQVMKTIYSPAAQIRNVLSGAFMVGANGNVGRDMNVWDSAALTIAKQENLNDPAFEQTFNMLQRSGIVDQNYVVGEYRNLLNEGKDLKYSGVISELGSKLGNAPFLKPLTKGAENLYAGNDNFWKTVGYFGEKGKYMDALRKANAYAPTQSKLIPSDVSEVFVKNGIAPRATSSNKLNFMDLMSTDIVKATMPTYSRVPQAIKGLRRIPITGNFMAFPAEIIRNSGNILKQGMKELAFKVDPNTSLYQKLGAEGAKELERQVQAIGSKRLGSYIAYAYGSTIAAQEAFMAMTDVDREQMDALKRLTPFFLKGHALAPIKPNAEEYVDLSYLMPYEYMVSPMKAALQAYQETGEITDSKAAQITDAAVAGAASLLDPFASEALLAERVFDVTVRGGRTKTGAEIFTETDTLGNIAKSMIHVGGGFIPGAVELFAKERRGEFEKGKITKGFLGEPGRYGEEYTLPGEITSIVTGLRPIKPDLKNKFYYNGAEYSSARSDITGDFRSFASRNDVSEEQIIQEYIKANNLLLKSQADLYADIQAAKKLNVSDSEILMQLSKSARLGKNEIGRIKQGQFNPIGISRQFVGNIARETNVQGQKRLAPNLPLERLLEIRDQFQGQSLIPSERKPSETTTEPSSELPSGFKLKNKPSSELPLGFKLKEDQSSIPTPAPISANIASMSVQPGAIDPNLLGNNPVNIQLAQRLGRA